MVEWQASSLVGFQSYREPFSELNSKLVRRYLAKYAKPPILEIGSGLGELLRLVPELAGGIILSDIEPELVEILRAKFNGTRVILADVYNLPFREASLGCVVGLSMLDTLSELERAVQEIRRVLKPNSYLVHFQDITPNPYVLFDYYAKLGYTALPVLDNAGSHSLFAILSREQALRLKDNNCNQRLKQYLEKAVESPRKAYSEFIENINIWDVTEAEGLLRELTLASSAVQAEKLSFVEAFATRFNSLLADYFSSAFTEVVTLSETKARGNLFSCVPGFNEFLNETGMLRYSYDLCLGYDRIKLTTQLVVSVARK